MADWIDSVLESDDSLPRPGLGDENIVLFLAGSNVYGQRIYSYVKMSIANLSRLRDVIEGGEKFLPSDYGIVISAGLGEVPDDELRSMRRKYQMVGLPPIHQRKG